MSLDCVEPIGTSSVTRSVAHVAELSLASALAQDTREALGEAEQTASGLPFVVDDRTDKRVPDRYFAALAQSRHRAAKRTQAQLEEHVL